MQVNYQYASPSMCIQQEDKTLLGLSSDLSRDEKVSFRGTLRHPLIYRDAMLMLREIVISDMSQKKKVKSKERRYAPITLQQEQKRTFGGMN